MSLLTAAAADTAAEVVVHPENSDLQAIAADAPASAEVAVDPANTEPTNYAWQEAPLDMESETAKMAEPLHPDAGDGGAGAEARSVFGRAYLQEATAAEPIVGTGTGLAESFRSDLQGLQDPVAVSSDAEYAEGADVRVKSRGGSLSEEEEEKEKEEADEGAAASLKLPRHVDDEMSTFLSRYKASAATDATAEEDSVGRQRLEAPLFPCEARESFAAREAGNSCGVPKRPVSTYFLTAQEERLALACFSGKDSPSDAEHSSSCSPRRKRTPPGYQLPAHCCPQEARIFSEVYRQVQRGGSSSSASPAAPISSARVQGPPDGQRCDQAVASEHRHPREVKDLRPRPPTSQCPSWNGRSRTVSPRQRRKLHTAGYSGLDPDIPFHAAAVAPWSPLRAGGSMAGQGQQGQLVQPVPSAFTPLKATLAANPSAVEGTPQGVGQWPSSPLPVPACSPRAFRRRRKYRDTRPRSVLHFPVSSGGPLPPAHAGLGFEQVESSERDGLLRATLDSIRGLSSTLIVDGPLAGSSPGRQESPFARQAGTWSTAWTVQNSVPWKFRLPIAYLVPGSAADVPGSASEEVGVDMLPDGGEGKCEEEPGPGQKVSKTSADQDTSSALQKSEIQECASAGRSASSRAASQELPAIVASPALAPLEPEGKGKTKQYRERSLIMAGVRAGLPPVRRVRIPAASVLSPRQPRSSTAHVAGEECTCLGNRGMDFCDVKTLLPAFKIDRMMCSKKQLRNVAQFFTAELRKGFCNEAAALRAHRVFTDTRFADLPLDPRLLRGIEVAVGSGARLTLDSSGAKRQRPPDILLKAHTGTGKTLAFLLPALQRLLVAQQDEAGGHKGGVAVLVLAPTRELVVQLARVTSALLQYSGGRLRSSFVAGGFSLQEDIDRLQADGPQILLATPGRLVRHLRTTPNFVHALRSVELLVLDEADRLLDPTFVHQVDYVVRCLPSSPRPQTVLCSATFSEPVRKFAVRSLRANLQTIDVTTEADTLASSAPAGEVANPVEQVVIRYKPECFTATLVTTLQREMFDPLGEPRRVLVLFPTVRWLQFFYVLLKHRARMPGLQALHRGLSDDRRRARVALFSRGAPAMSGVLFATDLAARGLDFDVHAVIQVGPPEDREQYVHRAGRTGRLTSTGRSILLLTPSEEAVLQELEGMPMQESANLEAPAALSAAESDALQGWWQEPALAASGDLFFASAVAFYLDRIDRFRLSAEGVVRMVAGMLQSTGLPEGHGLPALPGGLAARLRAKDELLGVRVATIRERWDVLLPFKIEA
ncbi:unnamed protein product [Polarella glacialis]|uniref:ATP-dependent RNA helicase n=1 Tax=Polarella glacialis TaxID=89957 RepID=A0A813FIH5_POLGL|nr:unnamed protein product [Polarella glacialis]